MPDKPLWDFPVSAIANPDVVTFTTDPSVTPELKSISWSNILSTIASSGQVVQSTGAGDRIYGRNAAGNADELKQLIGSGITITHGVGSITFTGASIPGSDTQVIFNDGGSFGADAGIVYNKTTDTLTLTGNLIAGASGIVQFNGRSKLQSASDGNITLLNNAGTGFSLLQLGGTGSSFNAIKSLPGEFNFRVANDSAYTGIRAESIYADGGNVVITLGKILFNNLLNNSTPALKKSGAQLQVRTTDDSADTDLRAKFVQVAEQSAPATPASGYGSIYSKTDGRVYAKDDAGTEYDLTGSGIVPTTPARALDTTFTPSATKSVLCVYSIEIACDDDDDGLVEIRSDAASPPTTVRATGRNKISDPGTGTPASTVTLTLTHLCQTGHNVRIVTTATAGSPTFTLISQTETPLS